jgi:hypothetical protein
LGQYFKKSKVTVFVISFLIASFAGCFFVVSSEATDTSPYYSPKITITAPTANAVFTENNVPLKISVIAGYRQYIPTGLQTQVRVDGELMQEGSATIDVVMKNLNNGVHQLDVVSFAQYGGDNNLAYMSYPTGVTFTVNNGVAPAVNVYGNIQFETGSGKILVSVSDGNSHLIYNIDNKMDITVQKSDLVKNLGIYQFNATFTGLAAGSHSMVVSATDPMGNSAQKSFTFNIGSAQSTQTPKNPETTAFSLGGNLMFIVGVIVVVIVALLAGIVFSRRKKSKP